MRPGVPCTPPFPPTPSAGDSGSRKGTEAQQWNGVPGVGEGAWAHAHTRGSPWQPDNSSTKESAGQGSETAPATGHHQARPRLRRPWQKERRLPSAARPSARNGRTFWACMEVVYQTVLSSTSYKARLPDSVSCSITKLEPRKTYPLRRRGQGAKRCQPRDLARPKKVWRSPDRKLIWGNQDTIKPLTLGTLNAKLTKRLEQLAEPKRIPKLHVPNRPEYHNSWGRGSVIWKLPTKTFFHFPTPRIENLAEPKHLQEEFVRKRPYSSPEWHVKDPSLIPEASVRVVQLSVAKSTHPDFVAPKQVETKITPAALHAFPSSRVISLSEPKVKTDTLYFERGRNNSPIRPVSTAAMVAHPSPRTMILAKAKTVHDDYLPMRPVQQPVQRAALKYVPSPRIVVLSTPNSRSRIISQKRDLSAGVHVSLAYNVSH
uniref:Theg spermatid protein like n=1 Tax=Sarcophilus harrisii TaxID=9305 RepID=A0A7N4P1T0_SARHA